MVGTTSRYKLYEKNSREEEAELSLKRTTFAPGVAVFLVIVLLLVAYGEPLVQHIAEMRQGKTPQVHEVWKLIPTGEQVRQAKTFMDYWNLLPPVKQISKFENALEEQSVITQAVLPTTQGILTGWLGAGNEQAYSGHDGWIFYRPDVDYFTTRGFLDPAVLKANARMGVDAIQPDPIKALAQFNEALKQRNITLIVMPAPSKPMVHPEALSGRYAGKAAVIQNPSYTAWKQQLVAQGILVFDAAETLMQAKTQSGQAQFLKTDTHWTPEGMENAATRLAAQVQPLLSAQPPVAYTRHPLTLTGQGDLTTMLKLPANQSLYPKERVTLRQVSRPDGSAWKPERTSDVLLLGDSFCNIFSLGGMGWGEGAGFAEQLSFALQRPVDKIVINAGGAFAARQQLWQEMMRGQDRLAGKRVVIYEFAMRDLAFGDWKLFTLPPPKEQPVPLPVPTVKPFTIDGVAPAIINLDKQEKATVKWTVPAPADYRLRIVDAAGKDIRLLAEAKGAAAGTVTQVWDGEDDAGKPVPAAAYTVRIDGTTPDGKAITPAKATITVATNEDAPPVLTLDKVTPPTFDPTKPEKATIACTVSTGVQYDLTVQNAAGKRVRALLRKKTAAKDGAITESWDGKDTAGKVVGNGTYTLRLEGTGPDGAKLTPATLKVTVKAKETTNVINPPTDPYPGEKLVVRGRIKSRAESPTPGAVPYDDCVVALRLSGVKALKGEIGGGDIIVYIWGMRKNKLVDAGFGNGATVTLALKPWGEVEGTYGGYNRVDLDDPDVFELDAFWGERK